MQEIEKSKQIETLFVAMTGEVKKIEGAFNEITSLEINEDVTKRAKRLRLHISKIRIEAEKVRKAEKEEFLRAGKAVDGAANILKWAIVEKEDKLREIENYFENQEKEKVLLLVSSRKEQLKKYCDDDIVGLDIMDDETFQIVLNGKKEFFEHQIEKSKIQVLIKKRQDLSNPYLFALGEELFDLEKLSEEEFNKKLESLKVRMQEKRELEKKQAEEIAKMKAEELKKSQEQADMIASMKAKEEEAKLTLQKIKDDEEKKKQAELSLNDIGNKKALLDDLNAIVAKYEDRFKSAKNKKMIQDTIVLINKVTSFIKG